MMKEIGYHANVISLRHHFFTYGNDSEEVYLNLIMDYIPETLYRVIKYYHRRKKAAYTQYLNKVICLSAVEIFSIYSWAGDLP